MEFDVIDDLTGTQTIATGSGIRELGRLRKRYGRGRWRKRKGFAEIRPPSGEIVQAELHWYEATGIGKREVKDQGVHLERAYMAKAAKRLFICLDNAGYEVSLERRKIYVALPDTKAERAGYLRIIDESGEDYLYPAQRFVAAELPVSTRRAVLQAA